MPTTTQQDEQNTTARAGKGNDGAATQGTETAATETRETAESQGKLIKYRGKEIRVPKERETDLLQKGFDYETKMGELNGRKEQLAELDRLQALMKENPTFREAWRIASTDPDGVVARATTKPAKAKTSTRAQKREDLEDDADDGDDGEGAGDTSNSTDVEDKAELKRQIKALNDKLARTDGRLTRREVNEEIDAAIKSYPWLQGKAAARVRKEALAERARSGADSIEAIVGNLAHEVNEMLTEAEQAKLKAAEKAKPYGTMPVRQGHPMSTQLPKLTKKDLFNGAVRGHALNLAKLMGLKGA